MSITLQPWKLKLLSIPKSCPQSIESCTHAIAKNIFFPRSRDTLFSFTQNALELAIVADVNVIAEDFLTLNLEGMVVTDDVFCAFMVDDPDGIDLILVKEKRIKSVLPAIRSLFQLSVDSDCDISSRGFTSESEQGSFPGSSFTSMNSFLHTPSSPSTRFQSVHYQYTNHNGSFTSPSSFQSHHPISPGQQMQQQQHYGTSISSSYNKSSTGITIPFGRRPSYGYNFSGGPRTGGFFGAPGRQNSDSDSSSVDGLNSTGSGSGGGGLGPGPGHGYGMSTSINHSHRSQHHHRDHRGRQSSIAESSFGDGIGRYFPKRQHNNGANSFDSLDSLSSPQVTTVDTKTSNESILFPPLTPIANSFPGFGSFPSLGLMQETLEEQEERESKIKEQIRKSCPRSVIDDKLILAGLAPDYQSEWAVTLLKVLFYPEELPNFSSNSKSRFISFTITDEGTSLIADQEVLGHFQEHMLNLSSSETTLRCIQVDLSTFGLDTYGLVYSMSNPLVDHGVNLLCLSTLRTANVLVLDSDLTKSLKTLSMAE
ncbi:GATS protein-like 3 [Mortierella claussenii]|nr:GATS protein-like 3 [Mortierella claussenii]